MIFARMSFQISSWPRWDYDLERGTLTFSANGMPKVSASIQIIGTTSVSGGTWMRGWANESLPSNVTREVAKVLEFGLATYPNLQKLSCWTKNTLGGA
jgi:hypothetical protein